MRDRGSVLRVVDELLWTLRRAGLVISTAQAIDAVRAVSLVGLGDRSSVREALRAVVVHDAEAGRRFDRAFARFFAAGRPPGNLLERLLAAGISASEVATLRELLAALAEGGGSHPPLGALLGPGPDLDRLLSTGEASRLVEAMVDASQRGFTTHKLVGSLGLPRAKDDLARLRALLAEAHGAARADAIVALLERELALATDEVRRHVADALADRSAAREAALRDRALAATPFAALTDAEAELVRRDVRAFVERLAGRASVRRRRARRGTVDLHATWRRAARTRMIPVRLVRKERRRDRPRLLVLCDISDSVRAAARFLLEIAYLSQSMTARTRTFVFISELGETTDLFDRHPLREALARAWGGQVISIADNSNYGRVLRAFEERHLRDVDRRTTVVILGDGRTNYLDDRAEVLDVVRARAKALYWLCPEPRGAWAAGDSAMARYAARCTRVLRVDTPGALLAGARLLLGA